MKCEHFLLFIGGSRGRTRRTPPTEPNSFVFMYIFTEKCPHRRAVAPNGLMPTHPNGKSWFHHCYSSIISPVVDPGGPQRPGPPTPVKTSPKNDGHHDAPQVSQVTALPPDKFLDLLLLPECNMNVLSVLCTGVLYPLTAATKVTASSSY